MTYTHQGPVNNLIVHLQSRQNQAGEEIGEQMSERRRAPQLAGRNPSIRLSPLPTEMAD